LSEKSEYEVEEKKRKVKKKRGQKIFSPAPTKGIPAMPDWKIIGRLALRSSQLLRVSPVQCAL